MGAANCTALTDIRMTKTRCPGENSLKRILVLPGTPNQTQRGVDEGGTRSSQRKISSVPCGAGKNMTTRVGSGAYTIAGGIGTSVAPRARNTATLAETAAGLGQTNPAAVVEEEETPARLVDEPEKQLRALRRLTSLTTVVYLGGVLVWTPPRLLRALDSFET